VGTKRLQFTAGSASAVSNSIDLQAGPLDTLVITQQPSGTATNGEPFPQQPSVTAYDADGNTISGLDVEVGIASGGGTLSGTPTASTNGSGVASFSGLTITGTVGTRTLLFSSGAVESESSSIDVQAGAAASVNITTEPPGFALDGVTFTSSTVVEVRDISNNLVSGAAVLATIASGTGTLGGTTSVATNPSGQASFSNLFIDASESPGDRTLQFASNGAADVSSAVHVAYGEGVYFDVPYCSGNASQLMDVYVPSNTDARPLPMAAYIHGGGWVSGDKGTSGLLPGIRDELLSRGYVVVSLNYRLATASTNQWPAQIEDVKCAIRHLRAKAADYGFDGVRIGTWGSSAGAHLAAMLGVTDTGAGFEGSAEYGTSSSRVEAAVPIGVISDLTPAAQSELDFFGPEWTFSDWPNDTGGELTNASPVTWATSDDPPFLIIHADEDIKVYPNQAVRLETALDAVGANVTLQTVANADHPLNDLGGADPSLAQIFEQVGDFFDNWVKGP
jgi:acetyl esterase/lipase